MDDPVDLMKPWTIKSVATRVSTDITRAAQRENLTTGQMLEKVWDTYQSTGHIVSPPMGNAPAELAALLHAMGSLPEHTPVPREVRALINGYARIIARGLPSLPPRQTSLPGMDADA